MILIDNTLTELVAGYARICQAERELPSKWRHRLLAAYAQRREAYKVARAAHRQQMDQFIPKLLVGLIAAGRVFILGMLPSLLDGPIDIMCQGCMLSLVAMVAMIVLAVFWFRREILSAPKLPDHPLLCDAHYGAVESSVQAILQGKK